MFFDSVPLWERKAIWRYDPRTPEVWAEMESTIDDFVERHKNHAEF